MRMRIEGEEKWPRGKRTDHRRSEKRQKGAVQERKGKTGS